MRSMAAIMGRLCRWRSVSYSNKCWIAPAQTNKDMGLETEFEFVYNQSCVFYIKSRCYFDLRTFNRGKK